MRDFQDVKSSTAVVKSGSKVTKALSSESGIKIYGSVDDREACIAQVYFSCPDEDEDDGDEPESPAWVGQVNVHKYFTEEDKLFFKVFCCETKEEAKLSTLFKLKEMGFKDVCYI